MITGQRLLEALHFAARKHRNQRRKGVSDEPYINHVIEVACLLARYGVNDPDTLIAAILHDTVEDTETTPDELARQFGPAVRDIVLEVTDDKALPKQRRKELQIQHAPHLSAAAQQLKIADKISNVRDITESPPAGWSTQRRIEYIDWAEKVVAGCRGAAPDLERTFDEVVRKARDAVASSG